MYELIVVEDEPVVRHGLSQYPWARWNLRLAGAFSGVQETLGWLLRHRVDLIITDVRMTDGNGLNLCERVRGLHSNVVTVVLSAYSEFELAQHAIDVGVFAYLVKPLDDEEIDGVLRRAVQSIEDYQRKDHALRYLREQTGLRDLVLGRQSVGSALPLEFPLVVGVVKASPAGWQRLVDGYPEWVRWSVAIDQAHTVVLVPLTEMERLQAGLVAEHLVSSWSGAVNALSGVHPAFLEARQTLESSSGPWSLRIEHGGPNNAPAQKFPYGDWFFVMDAMVQAAETLSGSAWFKGCDRLAEWSLDPTALDTMRSVVLELMYRIQKTVLGRSAERLVSTEWLAMIRVIEEAKAMSEVIECLRGSVWAWLEREEQGRAKERTSLEQQRALAFITSHLSSDLSAQATAEHLGMSLSQFSRWFQDSMGQHYLEYVTKLRIERARWLLATSDAPVAVIASQVGYSDARYFKHVFCERVGLGPGAFRSSTAAKKPNP